LFVHAVPDCQGKIMDIIAHLWNPPKLMAFLRIQLPYLWAMWKQKDYLTNGCL